MLSRTAESMFWAARYMERADTLARNLEVAYRMSLMPTVSSGNRSEWQSILSTADLLDNFSQEYAEVNQKNIEHFLIYSQTNPSSIRNCIRAARNNGREVRTALTSDVWSALNQAYIEFQKFENRPDDLDLPTVCEWVKRQAATVHGSFLSTQLRKDGYDFYNLGTYIERADNTARLLDIKYYVLLPTIDMVGGSVDSYQWTTLLRALSSYRSYYWIYGGDYSADKIADFLVLNRSCPRSLSFCTVQVAHHLEMLSSDYGRHSDAQLLAQEMRDNLREAKISKIVEQGLHEFLQEFITSNTLLTDKISQSFLFGVQ
jgi:uncharacterized alpha-E superfamily protein